MTHYSKDDSTQMIKKYKCNPLRHYFSKGCKYDERKMIELNEKQGREYIGGPSRHIHATRQMTKAQNYPPYSTFTPSLPPFCGLYPGHRPPHSLKPVPLPNTQAPSVPEPTHPSTPSSSNVLAWGCKTIGVKSGYHLS